MTGPRSQNELLSENRAPGLRGPVTSPPAMPTAFPVIPAQSHPSSAAKSFVNQDRLSLRRESPGFFTTQKFDQHAS